MSGIKREKAYGVMIIDADYGINENSSISVCLCSLRRNSK